MAGACGGFEFAFVGCFVLVCLAGFCAVPVCGVVLDGIFCVFGWYSAALIRRPRHSCFW